MSRKIHHGPNGSYKTSGALYDDLFKNLFTGRTIISNVRGLNDADKIMSTYISLLPLTTRFLYATGLKKQPLFDFELVYIDTEHKHEGEANLEKMRRFFHWTPINAFIIFDEVDEIFPPRKFTESYQAKYDYPPDESDPNNIISGKQNSVKHNKPATLAVAFSKHRHYNWDFIFTCTSIKNVHPIIRDGADMAYRHFNLANIGSLGKGTYKEIAHNPDNRGAALTDAMSEVRKKIPPKAFDMYESTSTGEVQDTQAGTSLWKGNFKLRMMTYFVLLLFGKVIYDLPKYTTILGGKKKEPVATTTTKDNYNPFEMRVNYENSENIEKDINLDTEEISKDSSLFPDSETSSNDDNLRSQYIESTFPKDLFILGPAVNGKFKFEDSNDSNYRIDQKRLEELGYRVVFVGGSTGFIYKGKHVMRFTKRGINIKEFCCLPNNTTTPTMEINNELLN